MQGAPLVLSQDRQELVAALEWVQQVRQEEEEQAARQRLPQEEAQAAAAQAEAAAARQAEWTIEWEGPWQPGEAANWEADVAAQRAAQREADMAAQQADEWQARYAARYGAWWAACAPGWGLQPQLGWQPGQANQPSWQQQQPAAAERSQWGHALVPWGWPAGWQP